MSDLALSSTAGRLEDEVYEFVSRTPNGAAFKVVQTVTMWSCCNEDEWSPGCILIAPTFGGRSSSSPKIAGADTSNSKPRSRKLPPLDMKASTLPYDDVYPDSELESPGSDLMTPLALRRNCALA